MKAKTKSSAASHKRSAAHSGKPAKATAAEKSARLSAPKAHAKGAPASKRAARVPAPTPTPVAVAAPIADPKPALDKRSAERRGLAVPEDRQSQLKLLIARGKEQGYLTYAQVNDHLPSEIVDPEQIEDIVNTINEMGIPVYEKAPDTESLLAGEPSAPADEEAIEEAAAVLAALDAELGRTTDPVRMYMREMGTVELLTREGEIRIARRIEEGLEAVRRQLAMFPLTHD